MISLLNCLHKQYNLIIMKSKSVISLAIGGLLICVAIVSCTTGNYKTNDYNIVGYVAGFRGFDFSTIKAKKLTHLNYAFANIINGEVMFDTTEIDNAELNKKDFIILNDLKKENPSLKILISVGGWGWSGNFSDAALNDSTRHRFANSAAKIILENNLDGIDLDWEYPNQPGAGNKYRPEDVHNFTLLLKEIRFTLDTLANNIKRKSNFLLTIATGGDSAYVANTELGEVAKYTDFINIMSYDLHNGNTWQTGHHTNLYLSAFDSPYGDATDRSVKMHLAAGVPSQKLNIGIPFYGRMWRGVVPVENGLYQKGSTTGMGIPYTRVLEALNSTSFERYWDTSASAPWLWNKKDSIFISYDDEESIEKKMEYVRSMKLGGVMFWEYTEDVDGKLLDALNTGLNRK